MKNNRDNFYLLLLYMCSSGKKESQKYPSFVGDLPVKIVQDIIDNLATNDDWETVGTY